METLKDTAVLKFNPDTLEGIRKLFGLENNRMKEAVDILENWTKEQQHFVKKDFDRRFLETAIIFRKGSLERAKTMIDQYCTLKTFIPKLFDTYDIRKCTELFDIINLFPLPYLYDNNERPYVIAMKKETTKFHHQLYYRVGLLISDYLKLYDYTNGYIFILDLRSPDWTKSIKNINLFELRDVMTVYIEGYGLRIKKIHLVTSSRLVNAFVSILHQVLSEKVRNRIQIHKTVESLHECIDKRIIPADLGGDLPCYAEHQQKWIEVLSSKEYLEYQSDIFKGGTNETLRSQDRFNEQCAGMPGTFRSLIVD